MEDDSRTALCFNRTSGDESQGDPTCTGSSTIRLPDWKSSLQVLQRNLWTTAAHHAGIYWYEMTEDGWFGRSSTMFPRQPRATDQSEQLWGIFRSVRARLREHHRFDTQPLAARPQVALLIDDTSANYIRLLGGPGSPCVGDSCPSPDLFSKLMHEGAVTLASSLGAPVRTFLLSDVLLDKFPAEQLRLVVFINALSVSNEVAVAVQRKLHQRNTTLLYLYAPGVIHAETGQLDLTGPTALTGLPLRAAAVPETPALALHTTMSQTTDDGSNATVRAFGAAGYVVQPYFGIPHAECTRDNSLLCEGNYTGTSVSSLVTRQFDQHRVIFSGALSPPGWLYARLAHEAGAHRWSDATDDIVEVGGNLLVVISGVASSRTLSLPTTAGAIFDDTALNSSYGGVDGTALPGVRVCSNCSRFQPVETWAPGEVHVYWIEWGIAEALAHVGDE